MTATMWLMVGLPGAGKTTRACELAAAHAAVRLTPDDFAVALVEGVEVPEARRDALEGELLDIAIPALAGGVDVVVDFGLWSREERTALRWLAEQVGARSVVVHLPIDPHTQLERIRRRTAENPCLSMSEDELPGWRARFVEPAPDELDGGPLDPSPPGATWGEWAAARWSGLRVVAPRG